MTEPTRHQPRAEPLACALDGGEMAQRTGQWSAVDAHALDRRHDGRVVRTTYPNRPDLRARVEELVEAERRCCPFLDIEVVQAGDVVELVLRYPPGADHLFVDALPD